MLLADSQIPASWHLGAIVRPTWRCAEIRFWEFETIWNRVDSFRKSRFPFLAAKDVERYLALEFPHHHFPPDFASVIHSKTEGSPLFMADLVRYLRDTGGIVEVDGTWATCSRSA